MAALPPPPRRLWESGSRDEWRAALVTETKAAAHLAKNVKAKQKLPSRNARFYSWTPKAGDGVTRADLVKLMEWKLTRGKMRPLMRFIVALDEQEVVESTKEGLAMVPADDEAGLDLEKLRQSVERISELKGVGPATASALLSRYNPRLFPFMSDEVLVVAGSRERKHTLKRYLELAEEVAAKARETGMAADEVERAIWASTVLNGT